MKKLLALCLLLFLSSSVFATPADTVKQFLGEWEGAGEQDNGTHWTIRLNIRDEGYFIDYPSLVCGGYWTAIKASKTSLVFKETLTYGVDRCLNQGEVVIDKIADHKARYYWFDPQNKIAATGTLIRKPDNRGTK